MTLASDPATLQDRIDSLAERAIKWASLTRKKNAEKKLAVTVFSFPPDKGNVGTAAYLNVFGSIYRVLKATPSIPLTTVSFPALSMPLHPGAIMRSSRKRAAPVLIPSRYAGVWSPDATGDAG